MIAGIDWGMLGVALLVVVSSSALLAVAVYEIGWGWQSFEDRIEQVPKLGEVPEDERGPAAMSETEHQTQRYTVEAE